MKERKENRELVRLSVFLCGCPTIVRCPFSPGKSGTCRVRPSMRRRHGGR